MNANPFTARRLRLLAGAAAAAAALGAVTPSQAALVARSLDGDASTAEAYFDDALGITWMANTRHLHQSMNVVGALNYAGTLSTLAAFNAGSTANFGYSGWRLPQADGVHTLGGAGCQFGSSGGTDCGENVNVASGELAYMFHTNLGNLSWRDTAGQARAGQAGIDWGLVQEGGFEIDAMLFWSSTASYRLIFGMPQYGQVVFDTGNGTQGIRATTSTGLGAWLVHDGDIGSAVVAGSSAVPTAGTPVLAGLGLVLMATALRRKRRRVR
jgi:hypothetical protein